MGREELLGWDTLKKFPPLITQDFLLAYCCLIFRSKPFLRTSLIFILSVLYNIVRFWEYEIDSKGEVKSVLRGNERFMLYYQTIATSLLLFAIPLCVLSLLNFQVSDK